MRLSFRRRAANGRLQAPPLPFLATFLPHIGGSFDFAQDDSGKQPEKTATAAMLQGVQDEIKERSQEHLSKDDVADIVVNQFGLASRMNEKSISLFKKLMKGMMK